MKEERKDLRYFRILEGNEIEVIPFYDAPTEKDGDAVIGMDFEQWTKISCHPTYSYFVYQDGNIVEKIHEDEKNKVDKADQIASCKNYLSSTDYVIAKLNELKLEDEVEFGKAKIEYKDVLAKRKEARAKINQLEA
nr:MAG TPA: hypothetical protein [Caudoviricetes sp.]